MLETVVPKTENAAVMIVGGKKHKREVTSIYLLQWNLVTPQYNFIGGGGGHFLTVFEMVKSH